MLQQEAMIERTRSVCREDDRLVAAMMYGSFAQGEGDGFSDIEFILFFRDDVLEGLYQEEWVSRVSPVGLYFVNEYGNGTAIFENLVRGEMARSLDLLGIVRDRLLQMVRVLEGSTLHWFNSAKFLETEISSTSYSRYAACTARLDRAELQQAYLSAREWGRELMASLAQKQGVAPPASLLKRLDRRFAETFSAPGPEGS
jgi:predicted nucleotidyltransferase